MRPLRGAFFLVSFLAVTLSAQYPPGTQTFFASGAADIVRAADGGVWVGVPGALVHYSAAGAGVSLTIPGTAAPKHLALAADGSIWFANQHVIGRISPAGVMLEQYAVVDARDLAVASDGALWIVRHIEGGDKMLGRITGGTLTESLTSRDAWSLAPAQNGAVWLLPNGFGTPNDTIMHIIAAGAVQTTALGHDVLFGDLQTLLNGMMFVGTGLHHGVLRRIGGTGPFTLIPTPGPDYFADVAGNLWLGGAEVLGYHSADDSVRFTIPIAGVPGNCFDKPRYRYVPRAIDSSGGVWILQHTDFGVPVPIPPCQNPLPPPRPELLRIDAATFLAQAPALAAAVPTMPATILILMAVGFAVVAASRLGQ